MLRFSPNANLADRIRWFEWEEDAFRAAREQDKPVMLFLSAFWCRYCQRMDEGALSERENMALLNAYFIALRVENAARPDIDLRYNLNGWPTIAFFTPAGELLGASNYLDSEEFKNLLLNVYINYQKKPLEEPPPARAAAPPPRRTRSYGEILDEITKAVLAQSDPVHGGYGRGQKFIHAAANEFLLARYELAQDTACGEHAWRTLDRMRRGQVRDAQAGGYFRTTTGPDWSQPHREKLLIEQAGLLSNCIQAARASAVEDFRRMAEEIIQYLDDKLFEPGRGAFLGCEDFLRREGSERSSPEEFFSIVDEWIYSDANALAARAYLEAADYLQRPDCRARALTVLNYLWNCCRSPAAGMFHFHDGTARLPGLLEDQAQVGIALLRAHVASGDAEYLKRALILAEFIQTDLKNPAGGYFDLAGGEIGICKARLTELDQNGIAASFFLELFRLGGDARHLAAAEWALDAFDGDFAAYGIHAARFGRALLELLHPPRRVGTGFKA